MQGRGACLEHHVTSEGGEVDRFNNILLPSEQEPPQTFFLFTLLAYQHDAWRRVLEIPWRCAVICLALLSSRRRLLCLAAAPAVMHEAAWLAVAASWCMEKSAGEPLEMCGDLPCTPLFPQEATQLYNLTS